MRLSREDVIAELNAVMPDHYVSTQAERGVGDNSNELLAQFVVSVALSLYDPDSTDTANLERIAVNLENASSGLAAASRRLRQLGERP